MGKKPQVPASLSAAGQVAWRTLTDAYDLTASELVLLAEVCHTLDELAALRVAREGAEPVVEGSQGQPKVHPLFAELRAHRLSLGRLVDQLALPAEYEDEGSTPRQQSARKAAETRWSLERQRRERRGSAS